MNATPETLETARLAFDRFCHGLATGEWNSFLETLAEDFSFRFPVGPFAGENVGRERASEFFHYVTDKVFVGGLSIELISVTSNENRDF